MSNAELAQIKTLAAGVITFGSRLHTGTITFSATTNLTNVVALQSPTGAGAIVLDDAHGSALNDVTGTVSLSAGTDGITATGGGSAATIVATGRVTLNTKGAVGSSTRPIVVDAPRRSRACSLATSPRPPVAFISKAQAPSPWTGSTPATPRWKSVPVIP